MVELTNSEGHLVLACKGWYSVDNVDIIEGIGRLHAAFCGWSAKENGVPYEAVADKLYKILCKCRSEERMQRTIYNLHTWMIKGWWKYSSNANSITSIQKIILFYISEISSLQIQDDKIILIKLPKPKRRVAKIIIRSNKPFTLDQIRKLEAA